MQIKVGKITDTSILKKIQNQDSSGFSDLMNYAKSNSGIYNKQVNTNKSSYAIEYDASKNSNNADNLPVIDLNGLEHEAYYYLYVKTDDENGKYEPNEAVTLAQASVYKDMGTLYLFFYGTSDFKWANLGDGDGGNSPNLNDNLEKDDPSVTPDRKLPQTGMSRGVVASIAATFVIMGISFIVYERNRDLR